MSEANPLARSRTLIAESSHTTHRRLSTVDQASMETIVFSTTHDLQSALQPAMTAKPRYRAIKIPTPGARNKSHRPQTERINRDHQDQLIQPWHVWVRDHEPETIRRMQVRRSCRSRNVHSAATRPNRLQKTNWQAEGNQQHAMNLLKVDRILPSSRPESMSTRTPLGGVRGWGADDGVGIVQRSMSARTPRSLPIPTTSNGGRPSTVVGQLRVRAKVSTPSQSQAERAHSAPRTGRPHVVQLQVPAVGTGPAAPWRHPQGHGQWDSSRFAMDSIEREGRRSPRWKEGNSGSAGRAHRRRGRQASPRQSEQDWEKEGLGSREPQSPQEQQVQSAIFGMEYGETVCFNDDRGRGLVLQ